MIPLASLEGRPPTEERREIESAILYVLRSGCPWRRLSHEFPAWGTVYSSFRRWEREGVWKQMSQSLRMEMRQKEGREAKPRAEGISSQPMKTSAVRGPEKGDDAGKKIWGRKRHVLVDTQGHLLAVKVLGAYGSDQAGAKVLLEPLKASFPSIKLVWGDRNSAGSMIEWMREHVDWPMQPIRALRGVQVAEGEQVAWEKLFPSGFRPLPTLS